MKDGYPGTTTADIADNGRLGKGNLRSDGHPNGGQQRPLQCRVCRQYFAESHGTLFYSKRYRPEQLAQILMALAEGLGIRATSRVFGLAPATILVWVSKAGPLPAA